MATNTDEDNMIEDNDGDKTTCLIQLTTRRPIKNPHITERRQHLLDSTIVEESSGNRSEMTSGTNAAGDNTPTTTDAKPIDEEMLARTVDVLELVKYAKGLIADKISLERELREQNDEVLGYRRDLYKTKDELEQAQQFFDDELNQKQELFDNEFAVLEAERRQFQDRNEILEKAAVKHDRTVQALKAALDEANRQCETLFAEVHALRRQDRKLGHVEKANDVLREQYDQLKKAFDELTATSDDYEWQMAQFRMEIDILTESKAALEDQLAKVTEEVKSLRTSEEQLSEERARNINLQAKVADLERKCDAADEMERKIIELESRNNTQLNGDRLAKELDQEKVRAAGLEIQLKAIRSEKRKARTASQSGGDGLVQSAASSIADVGKHQLQEQQLYQLRKKMDRAEKEISKLREENRKLNDERKLPAEKENGPAPQSEGSSKPLRRVVSESEGSTRPLKVLNGSSAALPPNPPTHQHGGNAPPPPASHMFQSIGAPPSLGTRASSPPESNMNPMMPPTSGYAPPPPGASQQQPFQARGQAPPTPQPAPPQHQAPPMHQQMPPQPPAPAHGPQQQPPSHYQQQQAPPQQHQQQQHQYAMGGYPAPPTSQQQAPPMFGQQQGHPQSGMPTTSYQSAGGMPPPPSSTPGAPPIGPPPTSFAGGAQPGANPFARGGAGAPAFPPGQQYVRPGFSSNY